MRAFGVLWHELLYEINDFRMGGEMLAPDRGLIGQHRYNFEENVGGSWAFEVKNVKLAYWIPVPND